MRVYIAGDEGGEARWVADRIEEWQDDHGQGSVAVLMRTNAQTRPFEEELTPASDPLPGGGGPALLAARRDSQRGWRICGCWWQPDDEMAFRRVGERPRQGHRRRRPGCPGARHERAW